MKTNDKNQKVGITFSTFDLFHAGHVKMIEEAKRQCDYLIVGLQLDPSLDRPDKNSPSQSIIERYIQLKGSKHIDEVVPYVSEQDLEDILRSFKKDTNDTRESAAIYIADHLIENEAEIHVYDPKVSEEQIKNDM